MIIESSIKNYEVHIEKSFEFIENLLAKENAFFVIDKMFIAYIMRNCLAILIKTNYIYSMLLKVIKL